MTPTEVRRLRRRLGLSQGGFARLVGVAPNTVARWERGELGMRRTTARLIEFLAAGAGRPAPAGKMRSPVRPMPKERKRNK